MDQNQIAVCIQDLQARFIGIEIALRLLIEKAPAQTRQELTALADHLADSPPVAMSDASLERTAATLRNLCSPVDR